MGYLPSVSAVCIGCLYLIILKKVLAQPVGRRLKCVFCCTLCCVVFVLYSCCMVDGVDWGGWIVEVVSRGVCHADHITAPRVSCFCLCAVMFWIGSPTDCISG